MARHGYAGRNRTHTYDVWVSMRQRCSNPESRDYYLYGAKGISVCDQWHDYQNFLNDMGEAPDSMSLDRIDGNGNYCKENCRWATSIEQGRNTSRVKLTFDKAVAIIRAHRSGRTQVDIADEYGIDQTTVSDVCRGKTWLDALEYVNGQEE